MVRQVAGVLVGVLLSFGILEVSAAADEFVPRVIPEEHVFVCVDEVAVEDIIMGGLYEDPSGNAKCGLIYAGDLTFIGLAIGRHDGLLSGEGEIVGVSIFPVQACVRTYVMAWPYVPDPHFTDPELAQDAGFSQPLLSSDFPAGTCARPRTGNAVETANVE